MKMRPIVPARVTHRAGLSVLYIVLMLTVLIGFVSLAVDVGRIRLARTELQLATDAAARAGAYSLPVSTQRVWDKAGDTAFANGVIDDNKATDTPEGARINPGVELENDEDIEFGTWRSSGVWGDEDNPKWTLIEDNPGTQTDERRRANAVHIIGRRIEERSNPIPLIFGPVVGVFSHDIERNAIAYTYGGPHGFGFIGIERVYSNGNPAVVDSMVYGQNGTGGGVASDGNIDLGNGDVYGDARAGSDGGELIQGPNSVVTGWAANLDPGYTLADDPQFDFISTPPGTPLYNPPSNGDWNIPPLGTTPSTNPASPLKYRLNGNLTLNGNKKIMVRGYVVLYVEGNVKIDGNHVTNDGSPVDPSRFTLIVSKMNTTVDIGGNSQQYMHLYAPESDVTVHGANNMDFYGWIVGEELLFKGGSKLHYDESRNSNELYKVRLVR